MILIFSWGHQTCKLNSGWKNFLLFLKWTFEFIEKKRNASLKFMMPVWFSLLRFIIESHIAFPNLLFKLFNTLFLRSISFTSLSFQLAQESDLRNICLWLKSGWTRPVSCLATPFFVSTGYCFRFHAIRGAACFPAWSCQRDKSSGAGSHLEGWAWKIGKMYLEAHPQDC